MMDDALFPLPLTLGNVHATFPDSVVGSDGGDDKIPWPSDITPPPPPLTPQRCLDRVIMFIIELIDILGHQLLAPEGRNFLRGFHLHVVRESGLSLSQQLQYRRPQPDVQPEPLPGPEDVLFWQTTYDTLFAQYEFLKNAKGFSDVQHLPYESAIYRLDPLFGRPAGRIEDDLEREFGRNARADSRKSIEKDYLKRRVGRWMAGLASDAARTSRPLFFSSDSRPARVCSRC